MAISISDVVAFKRLVAAGNDTIYYEDLDVAAGTMTELDTSSGAIDTSDQLTMFSLSQKVFVVNGTRLKIADFVNTKIYDDSGFSNVPARGDLVYQNGASPAVMVVDYANSGDKTLYGTVISGTFQVTTAITTEVGGAGDTILPSPSAPVSIPHWYDWEVYNADTATYGTMPSTAYLGCAWRGRAVLAGNPAYPYEWDMSRQFNPHDFQYVTDEVDPQVAVKGSVSDAGQVPDIPRALIPINDDYLVFGCAVQVECLVGDPAMGGSFLNLSREDGIFGGQSWCMGNKNTLYYFGTMGGIYRSTVPEPAVCISREPLPSLLKDEAIDPSTHRITMAYDRRRNGIVICITTLATGVNSNYWLDLTTDGFFPESYPEECAAYSLCTYPANDPDLSELLVGCTDGYIRRFDDTKADDDKGSIDESITSYIMFGPIDLSGKVHIDGILGDMEVVLAGGAGEEYSDSNDVAYEVYVGRTAEDAVEAAVVGTTPRTSGTFTAPGRQKGKKQRKGIRGKYAVIKLYNSTAEQTWSIENLLVSTKVAGRIR